MDAISIALPWPELLVGVAMATRVFAFMLSAPVVGSNSIPATTRIGFALFIALLVTPLLPPPDLSVGLLRFMATEIFVGLCLGFAGRFVLDAFTFAGAFAGHATSLAMANMLDPVTSQQTPILAMFQRVLGTLIYLSIGGHHALLGVLARSYEVVPAGRARLDGPWLESAVSMSARVIEAGFRLAAPVVVAAILLDVFLMLLARAAPQMNLLIVGIPLRITVGLFALSASLHVLTNVLGVTLEGSLHDAGALLRALGAGAK